MSRTENSAGPTRRPIMTRQEVESHNTERSAYLILDNLVCDVTPYLLDHPGGVDVLLEHAGTDATKIFRELNHSEVARDLYEHLAVAEVPEHERREVLPWPEFEYPVKELSPLRDAVEFWGAYLLVVFFAIFIYFYLWG